MPLLCRGGAFAADGPFEAGVDKLISDSGFKADGPGVAVHIRQGNNRVFSRCFGLARLTDRVAISPQTPFELASLSKSMTSTAILILHDRDKLKLSDDVRKHIPEFPSYDDKQPIRVRDLLQHVSGLHSYMDLQDVPSRNPGYWINEDYVAAFADRKVPLDFRTGAKHEYNNTNYMLLAVIIARITGKSYGTFMRDAVFEPAGMKNSFVSETRNSVPERLGRASAVGYEKKESGWRDAWGVPPSRTETLLTVGDGAIWSTLEDVSAWDVSLNSGRLVKPATARLAVTPSKTRDGKTNNYGLGWGLSFAERNRLIGYGHEGAWGGFRTSYHHDVAANRTTILLSNRGDFELDKFWYALNDLAK